MRRRWKTVQVLALIGIATAAAACGSSTTALPKNPDVHIGVMLSLTGADASIGHSQREAIELAVAQFGHIAGPKFRPTIIDESEGKLGVQRLLDSHVPVILGPTHSAVVPEIYSELDIAETPLLGISLTVPGLTAFKPFLWRVSLSDDRTVPSAVLAAANAARATSGYLIYTSNELFTEAEREIFESALANDGLSLLGESSVLSEEESLQSIVAAVQKANPSIICVAAEASDAVNIVKALRTAGLNQPIVGGDGFNSASVITDAGEDANNIYVGSAWDVNDTSAQSRQFVAAFQAMYHSVPDSFAAQAYAGMQVLREAVRLGGPTRAGIQSGFAKVHDYPTVLGRFSFDLSRDASYAAIVDRITNGKRVKLPAISGG